MSTFFIVLIIAHIVFGLIALVANYAILLNLLKKNLNIQKLRNASLLSAIGYILSWLSGGYYYLFWYGENVKPIIKSGDYAWAHLVVMEAKEHIFLLLPIMSFVIVSFMYMSSARLTTDTQYKSAVTYFVAISFSLAVLITLSGIIISGGAR